MTITTAHALAACSYLIDWQPGGKHMISDDDRDRLWDLLGIYHAHVVGHGSCQLAFAIGLDGVVKLETVQL